ncbi:uncharacterized protein NPIL_342641 [Nephila pilipes]|uniref:Transmembrane protein n=1 Tax=Nephila pilipes TaxID=299642 RepID=A0A8X6UA56_NEPPI|nr:uncharacterized protein NPIL_342641 [Nephila pilipes]
MMRLQIQILLLSILAVGTVIAINGFDDDFVNFNFQANRCVGSSGDQKQCDKLLACAKKLPQPLADTFQKCVKDTYPNGLGKCTDSQNLFGTSDDVQKYEACIINNIPQKSDLNSDELKQFKVYKKCVYKEGGECVKIQGN